MIKTGKAPLTVMTFLAIMSISLVVNLPGLAVTPMLGTLSKVFPDSTQLEKQLLTILPNLLIIPFVLLSGRLSLARHKMPIIIGALVLFCASAVWYLFASSMTQLIIISCLIGIGAGLLIPFSTGLIADSFAGSYRMNVMGLQSGISNSVLVIATFVVGWLSHSGNWHVPFAVYLVGLIPLVMCLWLRNAPDMQPDCAPQTSDSSTTAEVAATTSGEKSHNGFYVGKIVSLIAVYFIITFTTITISYYC
ncbi:MAG: MFS transporter, partial [Muribaculaceae bacterium]|nr:MFS transporter [Muribaculaceae bacterium]